MVLALSGCGQASQTVMVQLSAHGSAPAGCTSARFTVEEISVQVQVPGSAQPQWRQLLSDEEGARTFDLLQLGDGLLVAERDLPAGSLLQLQLSLDTDERPEAGTLPIAPGVAKPALVLQLPAVQADATHLDVDFDLSASLISDGAGGVQFKPVAAAKVMP